MILRGLHTSHVILDGLNVICKLLNVVRELIYLPVDGIQSFPQGLNKPCLDISFCRELGQSEFRKEDLTDLVQPSLR
jgi:hypothetical protein